MQLFMTTTPTRLRRMREYAGFTQGELARRLGRHQTWVSRRELGTAEITPSEALDWAEECGFTGALVFLPATERAEQVVDLLQSTDPTYFQPIARLLTALPQMSPERRELLLAMLATAVQ